MLNFVNCRFWRFLRFKPLCVLLRIIVHRKGNNANLGLEIAKNGYFCGFSETYLFGEPFWQNLEQSLLRMDKCLKSLFLCYFFALSLPICLHGGICE